MIKALKVFTLVIVCMMFMVAVTGYAQQTTGAIVGTVKDTTGAVVNTATVRATNVNTGFSRAVPTNGFGEYRIDYLPVGKYNVAATAAGFKGFLQENLDLSVDQNLTLDIAISAGAVSETVTVTNAPPTVNTTTAELGKTVEADEIITLPLLNRNVYSELSLTPGVMANSSSSWQGGAEQVGGNPSGVANFQVGLASEVVQVNGGLDSGNGTVAFYLDGGNNITGMRNYGNTAPNPDALEEFRVETSAFSAQYGQFSAAVVTVLTKSGTNKFHGSIFEFNRNTDFNAWNWVVAPNPVAGAAPVKPPFHRNNFGGTIGGPILHDKAFFFGSYAGLRQIQTGTVTGGVTPSAEERLGDFTTAGSGDTFIVHNPGTLVQVVGTNHSTFCSTPTANCMSDPVVAGNASVDPVAANFDAIGFGHANANNAFGGVFIPLPNTTGAGNVFPTTGGAHFIGSYGTPSIDNEFLGKLDANIGEKDRLSMTYFYVKSTSDPSAGSNTSPWEGVQSSTAQTNAVVAEVHNFSPTTVNQAWLTFTRAYGGRVLQPVAGSLGQTLTTFGSNFQIQGPVGLPQLNIQNGFNTGAPNAGPVTGSDNYELRDLVTLNKGKHNLVLGGEFSIDKTYFVANLNNYGLITTSSSEAANAAGAGTGSTGSGFADWIAGSVNSFEQDAPYATDLSTKHFAVFVQDNYRATPRFTANIGLRWDIDTPPIDAHNRTASFQAGARSTVVTTATTPLGMLFPGDTGVGRGIISTQFNHISPRLGFAWDPFGDGKTSVRAATGIFFGIPSGNEWNQPGNAAPFSLRNQFGSQPSLDNLYGPAFPTPNTPGGGEFPYTYNPAAPIFFPETSLEVIPPGVKYSSVIQFNASVQRQLPYKISATLAYVGTLGRHLQSFVDANYAPYALLNNCALNNPCATAQAAITPTTGATGATGTDARRQYDPGTGTQVGSLTGITYLISDQNSNYNALQLSANKSMSHGFSVGGFYVWSRALESSEPVENGAQGAQDFGFLGKPFSSTNNVMGAVGGGLQEERGLMNQNRDSNAAIWGLWNISYYHGSNFIVKELVNGWQFSPTLYLSSGLPFTVSTGSNKNDDSAGASRPNRVPGVSPHLSPHRCRVCSNGVLQHWFNNGAFATNGPGAPGGIGPGGADGNSGRNDLIGPGLKDLDTGIYRNVTFPWGVVFQFRVEITNVMNWVSLAQPSAGNITSGTQASITNSIGTQRSFQFGGRLTF